MTLRPPAWLARPLLAALVLRLAALALAPHVPVLGDPLGYVYLARNLRDTGELDDLRGGVRPPLYPALIALGIDSDDGAAGAFPGVYLLQIGADLAALLVLASLARRVFGTRAAQMTAWAHALFPSAALYAGCLVMAEPVALLCGAVAVERLDVLERALAGPPRRWLPAAAVLGLALAAGLLVKELGVLTAVAVLFALLLEPGTGSLRAGAVATALAVLLLATAPWVIRNMQRHGVPLLTGSFGHLSVIVDNAPPGESGWLLLQRAEGLPAKVRLSREIQRRSLLEYPATTAVRAVGRLRTLLGPEVMLPTWIATGFDDYEPDSRDNAALVRDAWRLPPGAGRSVQILVGVAGVALFALAAAGAVLAGPGTLRRGTLLQTALLLVACALTVAVGRYRLALLPFVLPLAGLALATWLDPAARAAADPVRRRRALRAGLATAALLTLTILVLPAP